MIFELNVDNFRIRVRSRMCLEYGRNMVGIWSEHACKDLKSICKHVLTIFQPYSDHIPPYADHIPTTFSHKKSWDDRKIWKIIEDLRFEILRFSKFRFSKIFFYPKINFFYPVPHFFYLLAPYRQRRYHRKRKIDMFDPKKIQARDPTHLQALTLNFREISMWWFGGLG